MAEKESNGGDKVVHHSDLKEMARMLCGAVSDENAYTGKQLKLYMTSLWLVSLHASRENRMEELTEIIAEMLQIKNDNQTKS